MIDDSHGGAVAGGAAATNELNHTTWMAGLEHTLFWRFEDA